MECPLACALKRGSQPGPVVGQLYFLVKLPQPGLAYSSQKLIFPMRIVF